MDQYQIKKYADKVDFLIYSNLIVPSWQIRGFRISQECTARQLQLIIPPGRRGHTQMLPGQVLRTKEIAQLRILVEQVIRRLKCFRILSPELPPNLIGHIDDILVTCSAVVNVKEPIMK